MKTTWIEGVAVVLAASLWAGTLPAQQHSPAPGGRPIWGPPPLTQPVLAQPIQTHGALVQPALAQPAVAQPFEAITPPLPQVNTPTKPEQVPVDAVACPEKTYRTCIGKRWQTVIKPHLQYSCWGYADLFVDRPFGSYMRGATNTQIANGLVAQLALYRYDFLNEEGEPAEQLSQRGRSQLDRMLHLLPFSQCPIIIEATANRELDAQRRASVLADLKSMGVDLPEEAVVVGRPKPRGMDAVEAIRGYRMMIQSTGIGYGEGDPQAVPTVGSGLGFGLGVLPSSAAP